MTGRTTAVWTRFYMDGYNMSGYTRSIGGYEWMFDSGEEQPFANSIKGGLPGLCTIKIGTVNGTFDNTATTGLHVIADNPGVMRTLMVPIGQRAAPVAGDPVFMGEFEQKSYKSDYGQVMTNVTMDFENSIRRSENYPIPWGWLAHAYGAETGANSANGIGDLGTPASTAFGGYMMYQVFTGDGTATIKMQDATTAGGSYSDISGLTSGSIDCSTVKFGVVAIAKTATIRSYTRWQIALGTATTVTFALACVRGYAV